MAAPAPGKMCLQNRAPIARDDRHPARYASSGERLALYAHTAGCLKGRGTPCRIGGANPCPARFGRPAGDRKGIHAASRSTSSQHPGTGAGAASTAGASLMPSATAMRWDFPQVQRRSPRKIWWTRPGSKPRARAHSLTFTPRAEKSSRTRAARSPSDIEAKTCARSMCNVRSCKNRYNL